MVRKTYKITWGRSVYYKLQHEDTHSKVFKLKKDAIKFLSKLNKNKDVDFTDASVGYYPLKGEL